MSGRDINIGIKNWTDEGTTVPVPKYSVIVTVDWTKEDNTLGHHSDIYYFPNALAGVPLNRLRRYMEDIIVSEVRIALGIDEV